MARTQYELEVVSEQRLLSCKYHYGEYVKDLKKEQYLYTLWTEKGRLSIFYIKVCSICFFLPKSWKK